MTTCTTRAAECPEFVAFRKHITDLPFDFGARLVFADWLQDRDDPRAEGWRFTARRELVPIFSREYGTYEWMSTETGASHKGLLRGRLWRAVHAAPPFFGQPRSTMSESMMNFIARRRDYFDLAANRVGLFDALDAVAVAYAGIDERFRGLL